MGLIKSDGAIMFVDPGFVTDRSLIFEALDQADVRPENVTWNTSGAEEIQHRFPKTRVVSAFKNVWWEVFDAPQFGDTVSDVFMVSDDTEVE